MTFGERVRDLRKARKLTQQAVADAVGIDFTYLSKIENGRLTATQFPGEETIRRLAKVLDADEDELLLLARKIPESIRRKVHQHPDVFRKIASLSEDRMDDLARALDELLARQAP
jgi:transcriptional regulator with XRE-family HTH domain